MKCTPAPSIAERLPVYNNKERGHDKLFREIASRHFAKLMDDIVGPEWRVQRDERKRSEQQRPLDPNNLDAWFPRR